MSLKGTAVSLCVCVSEKRGEGDAAWSAFRINTGVAVSRPGGWSYLLHPSLTAVHWRAWSLTYFILRRRDFSRDQEVKLHILPKYEEGFHEPSVT